MSVRLYLIFAGALAAQSPAAWGQEHPNGFFLDSPLSVSSGTDNGFIVGSQPVNDTVTILTAPTFAWKSSTHRTDFSLDYQPEYEFFARRPNLDAWNHLATLRLTHRINSRWSVDAGDSFFSTMDSSRKLADSLVLLPWGRFDQNTLYADAVYRFNSLTKITFRADNTFVDVAIPQVQGRLDNVAEAGTLTVDRSLTSHQQLSASYAYIRVDPLNASTPGSASGVNLGLLGYTYTVQPDLLLRFTAGATNGSQTGFTGSAGIEKRLGDVWIAAAYERYLGFFGGFTPAGGVIAPEIPFANGITPNATYDVASLQVRGQITRRIGIQGSGQRAMNGTDLAGRGLRSLVGQIRVDFRFNDRLLLFARADHYGQNINVFLNEPMSRNRYFGGLEIALTKPRDSSGRRYSHGKAPQDSIAAPPAEGQEEPATEPGIERDRQ
ncbi:MAG TPA: hypothetical protein VH639_00855 [Bryobacteraceae bacterium]|jgi:hypothetical protein